LFVDASGNVGVGFTPTASKLYVNGSLETSAAQLYLSSNQTYIDSYNYNLNLSSVLNGGIGGNIIFNTGSGTVSERMRLDSSGRLGLGTSVPQAQLQVLDTIKISNSTQAQGNLILGDGGSTAFNVGIARWNGGTNAAGAGGIGYFAQGSGNVGGHFFYTGDAAAGSQTERMRISATGAVGIGTTSPGGTLDVGAVSGAVTTGDLTVTTGSTTAAVTVGRLSSTGSDNTRFRVRNRIDSTIFDVTQGTLALGPVDNQITFGVNGSERARIDSSGRLLVGTSTSSSNLYVGGGNITGKIQIAGSGSDYNTGLSLLHYDSAGTCPILSIGTSLGSSIGSNVAVASGNEYGIINFVGNDGTNFRSGAQIRAACDGSVSTGDLPTRLVFSTCPDGSATPVERVRIRNTGALCVGTTDAEVSSTNIFTRSTGTRYGFLDQTSAATGYPAGFFNSSGSLVGYISTGASSTTYSTTSDYRLKENVVPLAGAIERLSQLQVHRFNFIADPDTTVDGFIAHEAQAVVPECVTGEKDAVNEDGSIKPQGIDQSKLVPLLTAALQEAIGRIETLEAKVAALEGA
jgi:hypothetical protein